jgi:hypothetical protein
MSIEARAVRLALFIVLWSAIASAQTVTVVRNVNLRPEQSSSEQAIRLLTPTEPPLERLEPLVMDGYYHVRLFTSRLLTSSLFVATDRR